MPKAKAKPKTRKAVKVAVKKTRKPAPKPAAKPAAASGPPPAREPLLTIAGRCKQVIRNTLVMLERAEKEYPQGMALYQPSIKELRNLLWELTGA